VAGRDGFVVAADVSFQEARNAQFELIADVLAANLDIDAVLRLIERGAPSDLPFVQPGAP
jgi:adenosylcobyric acid synthase